MGKRNGGADGSLTVTGHQCDFGSFNCRISQPVDSSANYSDTYWESHHGAGIFSATLDAQGFQSFDAADSSPNVDAISPDGANCVLQFASGCTLTGDFIISDFSLGHARRAGVSPVSITAMNASTLTFVWDETP